MRIAYFDCYSGISGDMTVAAFLDAGLPMSELSAGLKKLKLKGYALKKSRVMRGAIAGTKFDCVVREPGHSGCRSLKEILRMIDRSALSGRVKSISMDIFENIGSAEARVHGIRRALDVHLHELGSIDSLVDIVGTAIAVDSLGIGEVRSSGITMGRTLVDTAHGTIPVPGPAALELLKGVPVDIADVDEELVTPTGAGIVKTLAGSFGAMPTMTISKIGYGAGSLDLKRAPNMLRVVIGESSPSFSDGSVMVIEANIDDMSPQYFEHIFERLFNEGALDVYITPVQMKKLRPAFKLSVICERSKLEALSSVIFRESTTIGVRFYEAGRFMLERKTVNVRTAYGAVRVKISGAGGAIRTISPEHDDCMRAAKNKKVPLKVVYEAARASAD